jgi:hypothetical protein
MVKRGRPPLTNPKRGYALSGRVNDKVERDKPLTTIAV